MAGIVKPDALIAALLGKRSFGEPGWSVEGDSPNADTGIFQPQAVPPADLNDPMMQFNPYEYPLPRNDGFGIPDPRQVRMLLNGAPLPNMWRS